MSELSHRRVVTGLDDQGQSCVIIDGPVPQFNSMSAALVWCTEGQPADNSGNADPVGPYTIETLHTTGSNFTICQFPPNSPEVMHATDTIDYLIILRGKVTLVLEEGEADLGPGDLIVDRGVLHGWRNPHGEPCVAVAVNLPAHPVGKGRTI